MKFYEVAISWRPNVNSLNREEKTYKVHARNKASAAFQAAYTMGQEATSYLPGSETVEVRFIRSTW